MSDEVNNGAPEKWVNLEDIAKHLSVSHDTIRAWIRKGTIPFFRAGKQYKFKISEVDEWVRSGKITE
jgi:excisionase family DNA binding protein